jgi:hypothetical protein
MSIASLLELARNDDEAGSLGFCLPYPGVENEVSWGMPLWAIGYGIVR